MERPAFLNIVVALQKPDFQILKWTDQNPDSLASILGARMDSSKNLYLEVQNAYKKQRKSFSRKRGSSITKKEKQRKSKEEGVYGVSVQQSSCSLHQSDPKDYVDDYI